MTARASLLTSVNPFTLPEPHSALFPPPTFNLTVFLTSRPPESSFILSSTTIRWASHFNKTYLNLNERGSDSSNHPHPFHPPGLSSAHVSGSPKPFSLTHFQPTRTTSFTQHLCEPNQTPLPRNRTIHNFKPRISRGLASFTALTLSPSIVHNNNG